MTEDGEWNFKEIPIRDCNEEDLAKFYPIEEESKILNLNWETRLDY